MSSGDAENRNRNAAEYLQLLGSLSAELEKAMNAIAQNALADLEESIINPTITERPAHFARKPDMRSFEDGDSGNSARGR